MKRALSIQDISCIGKCSLTVALPVMSAMGIETAILPTAILSAHTAFEGFTFKDLTKEMVDILNHWKTLDVEFDAIYTGYLGKTTQVDIVSEVFKSHNEAKIIVDPVMGDNGKLYVGFDGAYVERMRKLCRQADIILPNVTEAAYLAGMENEIKADKKFAKNVAKKLHDMGVKNVVVTGVSDKSGIGSVFYNGSNFFEYVTKKIEKMFHGTGDVFASAFCGAVLKDKTYEESIKIAADFTYESIKCTDEKHWYGINFETALPKLMSKF